MKAYKIIEKFDTFTGKFIGRLVYNYYGTEIMLATETSPQVFKAPGYIKRIKDNGWVVEVNLLDEKWIHPHLYKPIKEELKKLSAQ